LQFPFDCPPGIDPQRSRSTSRGTVGVGSGGFFRPLSEIRGRLFTGRSKPRTGHDSCVNRLNAWRVSEASSASGS
jgi:hypothetical protein